VPKGDCFIWLMEKGQVALPLTLLDKRQELNLAPEDLGYLLLALAACKENISVEELAKNPWIKWSLAHGWACWEGKRISFAPLWRNLYLLWEKEEKAKTSHVVCEQFEYGKIIKWLDQVRGSLSVTLKEKQILQEFNLKYGWSTDFILIFLQLCFTRGQNIPRKYQPIAKKVYLQGIQTIDELAAFMSNLDWIYYQVSEVKKCVGQYGGVTTPQREMYLKWTNQWKFSHQVIMRAAEETVRTNNPSFRYIDGILKDWYQKQVTNVSEAEKALREHDRQKPQKVVRTTGRKRISRVDQRDWEKILGIE
jgi:DnaD/phage-associated family protein